MVLLSMQAKLIRICHKCKASLALHAPIIKKHPENIAPFFFRTDARVLVELSGHVHVDRQEWIIDVDQRFERGFHMLVEKFGLVNQLL
jgi:hypothetical protein